MDIRNHGYHLDIILSWHRDICKIKDIGDLLLQRFTKGRNVEIKGM
jgi:hypothetical protein